VLDVLGHVKGKVLQRRFLHPDLPEAVHQVGEHRGDRPLVAGAHGAQAYEVVTERGQLNVAIDEGPGLWEGLRAIPVFIGEPESPQELPVER